MQIFPLFRCSLFRSPLYGHIFLVLWFLFLQSSGFGLMTLSPSTVIQLYLPLHISCYSVQTYSMLQFIVLETGLVCLNRYNGQIQQLHHNQARSELSQPFIHSPNPIRTVLQFRACAQSRTFQNRYRIKNFIQPEAEYSGDSDPPLQKACKFLLFRSCYIPNTVGI